jgi:hypothetical protein
MEVVDTVDLVVKVHRERDPVQAVVAHAASEHKQLNFKGVGGLDWCITKTGVRYTFPQGVMQGAGKERR